MCRHRKSNIIAAIKRISVLGMTITLLAGSLPARVIAASEGNAGDVLNGEYVVIVNTNSDPSNKQSSGTIVFDDGIEITSMASLQSDVTTAGDLAQEESPQSGETAVFEYPQMQEIEEPQVEEQTEVNESTPENQVQTFSDDGIELQATDPYSVGTSMTIGSDSYTCIAVGEHSFIWMENGLKEKYDAVDKTTTAGTDMLNVYETADGPYTMLNEMASGNFPTNDNTGKLSILLQTIDGTTSGYYGSESNITAIHIKTPEPETYTSTTFSSTNGLLVHEGQHALFQLLTCEGNIYSEYELRWLNEGLSVVAMDHLWGGTDRNGEGWLRAINADTSVGGGAAMVYGPSYRSNSALDYSVPFLYVRYLADQLVKGYDPIPFLKKVYATKLKNMSSEEYMNALLDSCDIENNTTFASSLANFRIATMARETTGTYGFYGDRGVELGVTNYPIYGGVSGSSTMIEGTGAIIIKTKDGTFEVPEDAGADIKFYVTGASTGNPKPALGSGSKADPFIVTNVNEFNMITFRPEAYYKLNTDLSFNSTYVTIPELSGQIDGDGHTISGLKKPLVSYNTGTICNLAIQAAITGTYSAFGGIVANQTSGYGEINNVSVSGTASVTISRYASYLEPSWGNITGYSDSYCPVTNCSSTVEATVSFADGGQAGGLVGHNQGILQNCYSKGSITVNQSSSIGTVYAGGLMGYLKAPAWGTYTKYCYSSTTVTVDASSLTAGNKLVGRLCGGEDNSNKQTVTSVYGVSGMDMEGQENSFSNNACLKSSAELKTQATFVDWAFGSLWTMGEDTDGYPVFIDSNEITSVEGILGQTTYIVGESLTLFDATILVNHSYTVAMEENMINREEWDASEEGTKTFHGSYRGHDFTYTATFERPTSVESIQVSPDHKGQTSYISGQSYDPAGVVLLATLNGRGYPVNIYSGFTNNAPDPLTSNCDVTYTYFGHTVSQPITVSSKVISSVEVKNSLSKTSYNKGEKLNVDGATFQVTYNDGSKSPVFTYAQADQYGLHLASKINNSVKTFNSDTSFDSEHNGMELLVYIGTVLPGQSGAVSASLATIAVKSPLSMPDSTLYMTVGKSAEDNYVWSEYLENGSDNYETTKVSGDIPSWLKVEHVPNDWYSNFDFSGSPTTPSTTVLVYKIKDIETNESIQVTITIKAQPISSECDILSYKILKGVGTPKLSEDIVGVIDSNNTVTFTVPTGTDISSVWLDGTSSPKSVIKNSNGSETALNGIFDFSTTNPRVITVCAEDGVANKAYSIKIVTKDDLDPPLKPLQSISLNKTTLQLTQGQSGTLTVSYNPSDTTDSKTATWTSSNTLVATVESGKVSAKTVGKTTITANVNGKKASCTVEVKAITKPLRSISLNKTSMSLTRGNSAALSVSYNPTDTTDSKTVTWTSSNSYVATVLNGSVIAQNVGTAVITANVNGKQATCTVTVNRKVAGVQYRTHVQTYGWQDWKYDGTMSGTQGQSKRLEGICMNLTGAYNDSSIIYRTHVQTYGWQNYVSNGTMSGTSGEAKRLEAIQIDLTGSIKTDYDIYYRVHAQHFGWLGWSKNGAMSGTAGYAYRLEGIEVRLVPKGASAPGSTTNTYKHPLVTYNVHCQSYGWLPKVRDGQESGTTGQAKRLEGICINLSNQEYGGDIQYRTHIQTYGWESGWKSNGAMSGTSGQAKRLEAIQIQLTGDMANRYDVYYRVHAQHFGWLGWAKNGESAGTAGYAYRLESIQIVLVGKGGAAPGSTNNCFQQN